MTGRYWTRTRVRNIAVAAVPLVLLWVALVLIQYRGVSRMGPFTRYALWQRIDGRARRVGTTQFYGAALAFLHDTGYNHSNIRKAHTGGANDASTTES